MNMHSPGQQSAASITYELVEVDVAAPEPCYEAGIFHPRRSVGMQHV